MGASIGTIRPDPGIYITDRSRTPPAGLRTSAARLVERAISAEEEASVEEAISVEEAAAAAEATGSSLSAGGLSLPTILTRQSRRNRSETFYSRRLTFSCRLSVERASGFLWQLMRSLINSHTHWLGTV